MSSPNLNNLIIAGGVLVYCSVFISGVDTGLVDAGIKAISCQVGVSNAQRVILPRTHLHPIYWLKGLCRKLSDKQGKINIAAPA